MVKPLAAVAKILIYQIMVMLVAAGVFYISSGWHKAFSSLLGGVAAFIPNLFFALKIYLSFGKEPQKIVKSFYTGESGKLLITGFLFYLIFQIPGIEFLPLLGSYAAVLSVFWFALIMRGI